ncbi:HEAT repeat domain-containing protein [Floridanema evergladense]|uniref:HEAT repeat domain-containing protein n=1 Tax=Floridaenema evergladense BLCC-F167 TaxID=3153639 RepID=A0ABV4WQE2_9CYAN
MWLSWVPDQGLAAIPAIVDALSYYSIDQQHPWRGTVFQELLRLLLQLKPAPTCALAAIIRWCGLNVIDPAHLPPASVRQFAIHCLIRCQVPYHPALERGLLSILTTPNSTDSDQELRQVAAIAIAHLDQELSSETSQTLNSYLYDENPHVRKAVMWSLIRLPQLDSSFIDSLLELAITDPVPLNRFQSLRVLGHFNPTWVLPSLMTIAQQSSPMNSEVQGAVYRAVWLIRQWATDHAGAFQSLLQLSRATAALPSVYPRQSWVELLHSFDQHIIHTSLFAQLMLEDVVRGWATVQHLTPPPQTEANQQGLINQRSHHLRHPPQHENGYWVDWDAFWHWIDEIATWGTSACARMIAAVGRLVMPYWEVEHPGMYSPRIILAVLEDWICAPTAANAEQVQHTAQKLGYGQGTASGAAYAGFALITALIGDDMILRCPPNQSGYDRLHTAIANGLNALQSYEPVWARPNDFELLPSDPIVTNSEVEAVRLVQFALCEELLPWVEQTYDPIQDGHRLCHQWLTLPDDQVDDRITTIFR